MKSPLNFFKYWRKHGWDKTWSEFKYNYYILETPERLLDKKIYGRIAAIVGLGFAMAFMAWQGLWIWWIFMGALTYLQYIEMKQEIAQREQVRKLSREMEEQDV